MSKVPKDKRRLIRFLVDNGGERNDLPATGEVRLMHKAASTRTVKTSVPSRDNDPPRELILLVKDVMRFKGLVSVN